MLAEAETWVAVSFVLFLCLLAYLGVPKLMTKGLDDRADRIKDEIEEARLTPACTCSAMARPSSTSLILSTI